jgi:hypothetical protein
MNMAIWAQTGISDIVATTTIRHGSERHSSFRGVQLASRRTELQAILPKTLLHETMTKAPLVLCLPCRISRGGDHRTILTNFAYDQAR